MVPINTQRQQELFEEFVIREKRKGRFLGAFKFKKPIFPQHRLNLAVSYETLIIILIGVVLTASVVFSLGVERGRSLESVDVAAPILTESAAKPAPAETSILPITEKPAAVEEAVVAQKTPEVKPAVKPEAKQAISKAATAASADKPFTIQVASYKTRDLAEKESSRLKKQGYASDIIKKGDYYIICVGAYSTKEAAKKVLADLGRTYKGCYVRKR